jgi:hypothetical protein
MRVLGARLKGKKLPVATNLWSLIKGSFWDFIGF